MGDFISEIPADREEWTLFVRNKHLAEENERLRKENASLASQGLAVIEEPQSFPSMAEEAYHGPVREIVEAIGPETESDPALLLLQSHVFFGNAVGRGPHHMVEGTAHYPNFYALFVGATAKARKGTGDGRCRQVFTLADENWLAQRVKNGLSSGEGLINEIRDRVVKTVKGVEEVVDEGVPDKRLMIVQSEFAGAFQAMRRDGSLLSATMRDAWDGRSLGTLVKCAQLRCAEPHVSVIGHITEDELRQMLDQTAMANGFGNRFLFACVRRSKELPFGGNLPPSRVQDLGEMVARALGAAQKIGAVNWSKEGAQGWEEIYSPLSEAKPGLVGALMARSEAQVLRLAMTYALWDGSGLMNLVHLKAAMAVWQYCQDSIRYIFGDRLGDPVADTIFDALKKAGNDGLSRTDIQNVFGRNENASRISNALKKLSGLGLARSRTQRSNGAGRPTEVWIYAPGPAQP